jgi:hypothetical protein
MGEQRRGTDPGNLALGAEGEANLPDRVDMAELPPDSGQPPTTTKATSMISISPKWQMVLIGGIFIAINIMVMALFLVFLFLRR